MPPLWRRRVSAFCAAALVLGCAGQQLEGRWRGPLPLEGAKACVLNLYSDRRFDLGCGDTWIGAGRYRLEGDSLHFDFTVLHHDRSPVTRLPVVKVKLEGHGNEIVLKNDASQAYRLTRRL